MRPQSPVTPSAVSQVSTTATPGSLAQKMREVIAGGGVARGDESVERVHRSEMKGEARGQPLMD